ncbi:hypothetical protein ACFPYN_13245 [Paenisporosarcina macmurdoensis]|uniref:Uncharacterized protein n=1 Tax=Paenisporosarcina macmurdoensis TaxID=212659 RepID=A0ABW1LAE3_9BACL
MKTSLLKITVPVLAIGLAFSAQGSVSATSPDAGTQAKVNVEVNAGKEISLAKGGDFTHRLTPIDERIFSVNSEIEEIIVVLEDAESITFEEYFFYQEKLNSLDNRLNASTNQLNAVTKKFDGDSVEVTELELEIEASFVATLEAQNLLDSIDVVPELPEIEEPTEEPITQ